MCDNCRLRKVLINDLSRGTDDVFRLKPPGTPKAARKLVIQHRIGPASGAFTLEDLKALTGVTRELDRRVSFADLAKRRRELVEAALERSRRALREFYAKQGIHLLGL